MKRVVFVFCVPFFFNAYSGDREKQTGGSSDAVSHHAFLLEPYQISSRLSRRGSLGGYEERSVNNPQEVFHDSTKLSRRMSIENYQKKSESK